MRSPRPLGVALALFLAGAVPAGAQVVQFVTPSDTAVSIVVGDSTKVRLEAYSATNGVAAYSVTFFLDASRVQILRADSVPGYALPSPTRTAANDTVTLAASGTGYNSTTVELADVWFKMDPAAAQGSLVSMRVNTLTSTTAADLLPNHRTALLNVCQANTYWGDVTGDRLVNSRDALVTLTSAVGLPVTGFDLTPGDVDADSAVTSRDALMILSYSIRLYTGSARLGTPKRNRCGPLQPSPHDLLFFRSADIYKVAQGDTLPVKVPLKLAPYTSYRAVWSPDGTKVLYTANTSPYYMEIVSSTSPFATVDTLTRNTAWDSGPDWSADGTKIAFVSTRVSPYAVWVMNADGTSQTQLTTSVVSVNLNEPVAWSPDGTRIAFVADSTTSGLGCCGGYGIWTINPNGTGLTEVLPRVRNDIPVRIAWTSTSDSILYRRNASSEVYIVPATAGATGLLATRLVSGGDYPAGASSGRAFQSYIHYPYDFFLRRNTDGRHLRLLRTVGSSDYNFTFRKGP